MADANAGDIGEQVLHGGSLLARPDRSKAARSTDHARSQQPEVAGI
jgi:hypothetical protein